MSKKTNNQFTRAEYAGYVPRETTRSHRAWWVIGAVAVVVLIITIPVVMVLLKPSDTGTDAEQSGSEPAASGPQFGDLRWEQVGRTELPFSSTAGPRTLDGVTARGFEHSRSGAIMAAWQIPIRLAALPGSSTDEIYASQVIGTGEDLAAVRDAMDRLERSFATDQSIPRVIAWREHSYSTDAASFDYALPGESDREVRLVRFAVVWVGDDWRYQPGLFGAATPGPVDAASVNPGNGWTRFGGQ
jgi:hypothetical protein